MTTDTDAQSRSQTTAEIFDTPKLSVEKLPQLRGIFERTSSNIVEDLKILTVAPLAAYLNQVEVGDSWDLLDGREDCIAAIYYVSEWDTQVLFAVERRLLCAFIDAAFGSDGSDNDYETIANPTTLDLAIAREVFDGTARALKEAFAPLTEITLSFERIITEIEFNIMGPQSIQAVFGQILFQVFDSGGRIFVLIPQAPLFPLRKKMERATLKEALVDDPKWLKQLNSRVSTTPVKVTAFAEAPSMMLGDISRLRVGQILNVDALTAPEIILSSGPAPLFTCSLGQLDGRLSVKIERAADGPKGLSENVLAEATRTMKALVPGS